MAVTCLPYVLTSAHNVDHDGDDSSSSRLILCDAVPSRPLCIFWGHLTLCFGSLCCPSVDEQHPPPAEGSHTGDPLLQP